MTTLSKNRILIWQKDGLLTITVGREGQEEWTLEETREMLMDIASATVVLKDMVWVEDEAFGKVLVDDGKS